MDVYDLMTLVSPVVVWVPSVSATRSFRELKNKNASMAYVLWEVTSVHGNLCSSYWFDGEIVIPTTWA